MRIVSKKTKLKAMKEKMYLLLLLFTFTQAIENHTTEADYVSKSYIVAKVLWLQFVVRLKLLPITNIPM